MTQPIQFFDSPEHQPFMLGGENPTAVLMVHGFPGTPAEMLPLGEKLATAGITAQGVLLPGFGPDIARLGETGAKVWLSAVADAYQQLRQTHERVALIGFSMGGALVLNLAKRLQPDALVLLAPFWTMGSPLFNLLGLLKFVMPTISPFAKADFANLETRAELGRMLPGMDLDDPAVQQFVKQDLTLPTRIVDDVGKLGKAGYKMAPQVQMPTLIVQGSADATVTPANTRKLVARLGGAVTYHEIAGDHRFVKADAVAAHDFSPLVIDFLRGGV